MASAPSAADSAGTNSTVLVTPSELSDDNAATMLSAVSTPSSSTRIVIGEAAATRSQACRASAPSFAATVDTCPSAALCLGCRGGSTGPAGSGAGVGSERASSSARQPSAPTFM